MTSTNDSGPLAALLGRSLAANTTPVASEPAPSPEPSPSSSGSSPAPRPNRRPPPRRPCPPRKRRRNRKPLPNRNRNRPRPRRRCRPPKPGRIKHVFVVSLASSGYDAAFGATPQMPYLATTLRPQGTLLSGYSLLDPAALPNSIAAIGGQPPTAETKADCPDYGKCVYSAETLTLADQLGIAKFSWRAYMESMVNPETGQPDNCVYPQPGATAAPPLGGYAPAAQPVRLLPLAARPRRLLGQRRPLHRARKGPEDARSRRPTTPTSPPTSATPASPASAPPAPPTAPPAPTPSSPRWCRRSSPPPPTRRTAC